MSTGTKSSDQPSFTNSLPRLIERSISHDQQQNGHRRQVGSRGERPQEKPRHNAHETRSALHSTGASSNASVRAPRRRRAQEAFLSPEGHFVPLGDLTILRRDLSRKTVGRDVTARDHDCGRAFIHPAWQEPETAAIHNCRRIPSSTAAPAAAMIRGVLGRLSPPRKRDRRSSARLLQHLRKPAARKANAIGHVSHQTTRAAGAKLDSTFTHQRVNGHRLCLARSDCTDRLLAQGKRPTLPCRVNGRSRRNQRPLGINPVNSKQSKRSGRPRPPASPRRHPHRRGHCSRRSLSLRRKTGSAGGEARALDASAIGCGARASFSKGQPAARISDGQGCERTLHRPKQRQSQKSKRHLSGCRIARQTDHQLRRPITGLPGFMFTFSKHHSASSAFKVGRTNRDRPRSRRPRSRRRPLRSAPSPQRSVSGLLVSHNLSTENVSARGRSECRQWAVAFGEASGCGVHQWDGVRLLCRGIEPGASDDADLVLIKASSKPRWDGPRRVPEGKATAPPGPLPDDECSRQTGAP